MIERLRQKRYDAIIKMMRDDFGGDEAEQCAERDPMELVKRYLKSEQTRKASDVRRPHLLYGMSAPSASLGKKGDFYLEAGDGVLWGPKEQDYGWNDMMPLHDDYEAPDEFIKDALGVSGVIR